MALKRSLFEGLGLNENQIQAVIDNHMETVDALKAKITDYETQLEAAKTTETERDNLKKQVEDLQKASGDASKVQKAFDDFKAEVAAKETNAKKTAALDGILKGIGITSESARKLILKGYDLNGIEMDDAGAIKTQADIEKAIKTDYADLIST